MKSFESWKVLEDLQNISEPNMTKNSLSLFKNCLTSLGKGFDQVEVVDLGCGSGNLASQIFSTSNPIKSYTGVDINQVALDLFKTRGLAAEEFNLVKADAKEQDIKGHIYLSLSNTFLALGDWKGLEQIIKKIFSVKEKRILIASIVPWDEDRIKWHQNFKEWIDCHNGLKMRSVEKSVGLKVEQKLEIRKEKEVFTYSHNFLKTTFESFESFVQKQGFFLHSWYNPYLGEEVDIESYKFPDALAVMRNF